MKLLIKIENGIIKLILKKDNKAVDELVFPDEHNLTEKLLVKIDELLKRNKSEPSDVIKVDVETDQGDAYTTSRIAKTVAVTFNFAAVVDKSD